MNKSIGSTVVDNFEQGKGCTITLDDGKTVLHIFWVTIEGPIGAGKSELIKVVETRLCDHFGKDRVYTLPENVAALLKSGLFQRYQKDPSRYAYQFQTKFFHTRTKDFLECWDTITQQVQTTHDPVHDNVHGGKIHKKVVLVTERSIFSDVIFMNVQQQCGNVDDDEYTDYLDLNSMWRLLYPIKPNLVIYCRPGADDDTIVNTCHERVVRRARDSELDLVDKNYNATVLREHDKMFNGGVTPAQLGIEVPVVLFDTTENYKDDHRIAMKKSGEVLSHINERWRPQIACAGEVSQFIPDASMSTGEKSVVGDGPQ